MADVCNCCGNNGEKGVCGRCLRNGGSRTEKCAIDHAARPDYAMFELEAEAYDY